MSRVSTAFDKTAPGKPEVDLVRMDLFGDGLVSLDVDGSVRSANMEALSMLGLRQIGRVPLSAVKVQVEGWDDVLAAVATGRRAELPLRVAGGRSVIVKLRKAFDNTHVSLLVMQDIEGFEFVRYRAFGRSRRDNVRFISTERTRPDFATQRRLDPELNRVLSRGEVAVRQGARILITGESGVGKSEIARFLHLSVSDAHDPFIVVNCASATADRPLDATLFGLGETGGQRQPGAIELAESGTLLLDEVGEIPLSVQARLLSFLEDGHAPAAGGSPRRAASVRIIAATNRNLIQMLKEGRFRADLYFRLAVVQLHVPPLRDMQPLVPHLIDRFQQTINYRRVTPIEVPARLRDILSDYSFPGNIRELLNIVQRIAVFVEADSEIDEIVSDLIAPMDIPGTEGHAGVKGAATFDLRSEVRRFERALIDKAIRVHGSKRKAALALGINIGTVVRKTTEAYDEGND